MKIAVTAATGRLGQAVLHKLAEEVGTDQLLAIARDPAKFKLANIQCLKGDYNSVAEMTAALAGVDTVVMISAPVTPGTDRIEMHRKVIEAAKKAGVRKIIFTSVIGGDNEQNTLFAATQAVNRQAEADLQASGLDWIVARNGLYLELDLGHIILADKNDGVYRNNAGDGRAGYISIDEIAAATARLALGDDCLGQVLNIIGETLSQAELVQMASEVFDLNVRYEPMSVDENIARFMADERIAARGEEVARMLTGCFQCIAQGDFDVASDFERAVGRPPKSVRQQMQEHRERLAA
jgi:NAD(P)H dehydrogenase (quinone)